MQCFTTSKANAFENLLEPLQKLLRLSPPVAQSLARPDLFSRILQKLRHHKAVIRLNLLRIVRSICDSSDDDQGQMIRRHGLFEAIQRLAQHDSAVLVRNLADELVKSSLDNAAQSHISSSSSSISSSSHISNRRRTNVLPRLGGSNITPPRTPPSSTPTTPIHHPHSRSQSRSSIHSSVYYDAHPKSLRNGHLANAMPFRQALVRDPSSTSSTGSPRPPDGGATPTTTRSRLPRTSSTRLSRQSMASGLAPVGRAEAASSKGREREREKQKEKEQGREKDRDTARDRGPLTASPTALPPGSSMLHARRRR